LSGAEAQVAPGAQIGQRLQRGAVGRRAPAPRDCLRRRAPIIGSAFTGARPWAKSMPGPPPKPRRRASPERQSVVLGERDYRRPCPRRARVRCFAAHRCNLQRFGSGAAAASAKRQVARRSNSSVRAAR